MKQYDKIIIGAGLYGLYAADFCASHGMKVLVLEKEAAAFTRATYINQARVHMGYHYPRSLATAIKSAGYFQRFCSDYSFCINDSFEQIYATSKNFSWTDAAQFKAFCDAAGIKCDDIPPDRFFNDNLCDGAFVTTEYTYDAKILCEHFLEKCSKSNSIDLVFNATISDISRTETDICVSLSDGEEYAAPFLLNATYASVNEIIRFLCPDDLFKIKYELCEIILCETGDTLKNIGLTVMDGPFFSIMPFGMTGMHSLTSVTFTPHSVSHEEFPSFACQKHSENGVPLCSEGSLGNCNLCPAKPKSAWPYMSHLAQKYMRPEYGFRYNSSLYSMKPILTSSEIDDSRPTAIKVHFGEIGKKDPVFVSVLSGKINTVYDLDEYLV